MSIRNLSGNYGVFFVFSCSFRGLNSFLNWFAILYCIFNGVFLNHLQEMECLGTVLSSELCAPKLSALGLTQVY